MPLRRKRTKGRRYRRVTRRRTTRRRTGSMRLMKSVARRVAKNLAETKRYARVLESASAIPSTTAASQWSLRHVFAPLAVTSSGGGQGTASYQFIGNEIVDPMVKFKFSWYLNWEQIRRTITNYGTIGLNVCLIAVNNTIAAANTGFVNAATVANFDWFYNPDAYNPTFNGNNVRVLKKWSRLVTPDQLGPTTVQGNQVVRGRLSYRWRRKLTFEDFATIPQSGGPSVSPELRGYNYYIITGFRGFGNWGGTSAGVPDAFPQCIMDQYLYYKDP
nr:capsid protein [Gopherus associated circular DNA virus 2]